MTTHTHVDETKRKFLERLLVAGAYSLAGGFLLPSPARAMGKLPRQLDEGKSIYELSGQVTVNGKPADLNTLIYGNSVIETGDDSYLIFAVGHDAFIMREKSRLELAGNQFLVNTLNLVKGKLLSVFGKSRHKVQTSTVTVGIRGTGLYIESAPEVSYVCTCYGSVELQSTKDLSSREIITSSHHDAPRFIHANAQKGQFIEPGPFINHTDMELMLIEELVGRSLPFLPGDSYDGPRRSY